MKLSGRLTTWQQQCIRLRAVLLCLLCAGMGEAMFYPVARSSPALDPGLRAAVLAFGPVIGLIGFAFVWWINSDSVVEFSCNDSLFRFRKLGATETETRSVSDIVKVRGLGRGGTTGYCIGFRDGTEVSISTRIMPDGPMLGEWFQTHLGKATTAHTTVAPSGSGEGWRLPPELRWPAPRRVRLTNGATALCVVTLLFVVGGDAGMISYRRDVTRRAAALQQKISDSRETEGVVTRRWKAGGKYTSFLITYRYSAGGAEWEAPPAGISRRHWEKLYAGAPISILYPPGNPAHSFPKEDPERLPPAGLAWVIMPILTGLGILPFALVFRARRYLVYGKAVGARISLVIWRPGTPATVYYQFPLGDGNNREGSYVSADVPPPEGSMIPVLYDPKDPSRNTRYPVGLVMPADD